MAKAKPLEPGTRFGHLTVLSDPPLRKTTGTKGKTALFYHCKCDCGNDIWYRRSDLVEGKRKSCGCVRNAEVDSLNRIKIRSSKPVSSNTSGHTGIVMIKSGKYRAYYNHKGKFYHVGVYDDIEEAAKAREEAVNKFLEEHESEKSK